MRACSKTGCSRPAAVTCSFNYGQRQIWLSPLREEREPGSMDLCTEHAARFGAPVGWEIADLRTEHGRAAAVS